MHNKSFMEIIGFILKCKMNKRKMQKLDLIKNIVQITKERTETCFYRSMTILKVTNVIIRSLSLPD